MLKIRLVPRERDYNVGVPSALQLLNPRLGTIKRFLEIAPRVQAGPIQQKFKEVKLAV